MCSQLPNSEREREQEDDVGRLNKVLYLKIVFTFLAFVVIRLAFTRLKFSSSYQCCVLGLILLHGGYVSFQPMESIPNLLCHDQHTGTTRLD